MARHPEIGRVLSMIRADSVDEADDAATALDWLIGERGPEALTQARAQEFLWWALPRKWFVPHEERMAVAEALARAFDLLGMARYAGIARSHQTEDILRAWDRSEREGFQAFRRAVSRSAVEPVDFDGFEWGVVVGAAEHRALDQVSAALELAIAGGGLARGGRGAKAAREAFVRAWMAHPQPGFESTPLEAVRRERTEAWLGHAPLRRGMLEPLVPLLEPSPDPPAGFEEAAAPLRLLLMRIRTGVELADKGALNRAFVQKLASSFGWDDTIREPRNEEEVWQLHGIHSLARSMRAVRRTGRREAVTRVGVEWATHPTALWHGLSRHFARVERRDFQAAVTELALAILLTEKMLERDEVARRVGRALLDAGWHRPGRSKTQETDMDESVNWQMSTFVRPAAILGLIDMPGWPDRRIGLSSVGQALAVQILALRAIAPQRFPS